MALPIVPLLIGAAGAGVVVSGVIVYFLVSSKGKKRLNDYKAKVNRIVELLDERIRKLEEIAKRVEELTRERNWAQAANLELESRARELEAELARWKAEAGVVSGLRRLTGSLLTPSLVRSGLSLIRESSILGSKVKIPTRVLPFLDERYRELDSWSLAHVDQARRLLLPPKSPTAE